MMLSLLCTLLLLADPPKKEDPKKDKPAPAIQVINGLKARSLGPALTSGRVVGFAVHPNDRAVYYAVAGSGGVWKTVNNGASWTPVFDGEGSYSIGCVVMDPKDPNTLWVGTGENNSQRSVGYGDGVYKSTDGGKSWKNMGLKDSEHIGKIAVDPRDSNIVYVAAQGPLWREGGDRGFYKTTDGGKTWNKILNISENTGVTDFTIDPRNPDLIVAASYQRRRHVWTIVNGGPESAIHRSTDGGKTWNKVTAGLPGVELGRIGLANAPTDPDVIYAIIEAADKKGGIFRSTDKGSTWSQMSDYDRQAQYYSHLVVDPVNKDRIYAMNVFIAVSDDGGKTMKDIPDRFKHVDNHEIWIDPKNPSFYRVGCDGGIYESHDRGATWAFVSNLPITQFYDVACDENAPFYNVYGGTQDNFTLGGPARNRSQHGIMNSDWFVVQGGDGFHCKADPKDPDTVYGEYQYGGLCRFNRKTGTRVGIQPQPAKGEANIRWNWDSPLVLSHHKHTRLYYAGNRVYRSDDRGDRWTAISGDITRQLDRDTLPVFGKIQGPDAVFKHASTSPYGNVTALAESVQDEKTLYAGTDDGLIQITRDGGATWKKVESFPGVPDRTYVSKIVCSLHDGKTLFACFDNHKMGDFKPYVLKSTDGGETWKSIAGNLPERGGVFCVAEDHVDRDMLFVGTEFGLYVTLDGGQKWERVKGGLPTIQVKDLCIQRQMNDLVVGTFGRGIYILDNYASLRKAKAAWNEAPAAVVSITDGLIFPRSQQYGGGGKGFLGESFYLADNPAYGATISYHLKDGYKTKKQLRKEAEKKPDCKYPTLEELRAETEEDETATQVVILYGKNEIVRVLPGATAAGIHSVNWDLRWGANDPASNITPIALPGGYEVEIRQRVNGEMKTLSRREPFQVTLYESNEARLRDLQERHDFQVKQKEVAARAYKIGQAMDEFATKLETAKKAVEAKVDAKPEVRQAIVKIQAKLRPIQRALNGDGFAAARQEVGVPSVRERLGKLYELLGDGLDKPSRNAQETLLTANIDLLEEFKKLKELVEGDWRSVESELDRLGIVVSQVKLPK